MDIINHIHMLMHTHMHMHMHIQQWATEIIGVHMQHDHLNGTATGMNRKKSYYIILQFFSLEMNYPSMQALFIKSLHFSFALFSFNLYLSLYWNVCLKFSPFFASNMTSYASSSTSTSSPGSTISSIGDVKSFSSNYPYFGQFNLDWKTEGHI